jgi:hypothetical protein
MSRSTREERKPVKRNDDYDDYANNNNISNNNTNRSTEDWKGKNFPSQGQNLIPFITRMMIHQELQIRLYDSGVYILLHKIFELL